tara:strand:+ start:290 stop:790 length:501 start_codon:yes stop_codon:yes gene_type:complete
MYKYYSNIGMNELFLTKCVSAMPELEIKGSLRARCIGWNQDISIKIGNLIIQHEKVGTYSLPWIHDYYPHSQSQVGELIVQVLHDGTPYALIKVISLQLLNFGDITSEHTALDGPPVRDFNVWMDLHTKYWNSLLLSMGRKVEKDMPVIIEKFLCVFSTDNRVSNG